MFERDVRMPAGDSLSIGDGEDDFEGGGKHRYSVPRIRTIVYTLVGAPTPLFAAVLQVLTGIVLGVILGVVRPEYGAEMKPLGDGFIKLIRMIIAPVIFTTVVSGIATMGDIKDLGRIGVKTLLYFEVITTPLALIIALVVVNVLQPGAGINADPATLDASAVAAYTTGAQQLTTVSAEHHSDHSVDAFARGEILQVLFVSVLFGLALLYLGDRGRPLSASSTSFRRSSSASSASSCASHRSARSARWRSPSARTASRRCSRSAN